MQGTLVMLLALSGLGCHHKQASSYATSCYSSCYSSGCYSSCYGGGGCYSSNYGGGCYSSCYSGGGCYGGGCYGSCYSSCYSGAGYSPAMYGCYSGYSSPRHHHGMFGHKRRSCQACCAPAPVQPVCDPCAMGNSYMPVYGTYTPVYEGYASGQTLGASQMSPAPAPAPSGDIAPAAPSAPSPGNPAPPAAPAPVEPPPAPAPVTPPPAAGF